MLLLPQSLYIMSLVTSNDVPTIFFFFIVFLIYLLPAIIASIRDHRNAVAIAVFNLLLGWTFIGWAIALAWACARGQRATR
jgi:hypothetical protein